MDYSYFTVAPQPYQFFGVPDYSNPPLEDPKITSTDLELHQPQPQAYIPYDASASFIAGTPFNQPQHGLSPPLQQHPVGSVDSGIDIPMELDAQPSMARTTRSSSEEKDGNGNGVGLTPAQSRRKAQNRAAQRAFRERKERHVKSLEAKLSALENQTSTLETENERLKLLLQRAKTENEILRATSSSHRRAGSTSSQFSSTRGSPTSPNGTYEFDDPDKDREGYEAGPAVVTGQAASAILLSTGGTWDLIQSHPLVKSGEVDVADVCERLRSRARCDGQGPAFEEGEVWGAVEECRRSGGDGLI